jgi:ArsR family transcriptional regulator
MLALARSRLARPGLTHCAVRLADMYRLPLGDASMDVAVLQMVLHYAEDPAGAVAEAARILRPGGRLVVVDLAEHDRAECRDRLAHRWPGFSDARMNEFLAGAGLKPVAPVAVSGPMEVRLWSAHAAAVPAPAADLVLETAR